MKSMQLLSENIAEDNSAAKRICRFEAPFESSI
jgi:hypothetical protein